MIKVFNTLTNKKEVFQPQDKNNVSMYICGITPYDEVHLGHARAYAAFDIIKRHLINSGYGVTHVQNFTDIDDKIIARAKERNLPARLLAKKYIDDYFVQTDKLNILRANSYPLVTDMIPNIIAFIKVLMDKGFAYQAGGDVYYDVAKFKDYGKLSKQKLEDRLAGARVEINDNKRSSYDFALWKQSKPDDPQDVCWQSPWGMGRPGWHIECSVMSSTLLGETIDIHGGGRDLIFPHHENEIAQSEAKSGCCFVKYWIHNGFVTIDHEKMSKSLGNFFTLSDIFKKYSPRVIRYYLISQHYRSPLDFSDENVDGAKNALDGLDDAFLRLIETGCEVADKISDKDLQDLYKKFTASLDDDFNSQKALSYLHELKNLILTELQSAPKERLSQMRFAFKKMAEDSLGLVLPTVKKDEEVLALLEKRNIARLKKDWASADALRKAIDEKGYKIVDNADGSSSVISKN
ncbi:MAG: cysteine--tRNA ligase [Elusimicrobiota bacterium]|jgi:cysteinyl-tRNA synthetase|nr:cysteine--tRNA ligase [Elusimicrobiota bacterium]